MQLGEYIMEKLAGRPQNVLLSTTFFVEVSSPKNIVCGRFHRLPSLKYSVSSSFTDTHEERNVIMSKML